MKQLVGDQIQEVINQPRAILKASASWCRPCSYYSPILEQFSEETGIPVYEVDVEANPEFVELQDLHAVPHTFVYVDGKLVHEFQGPRTLEQLHEMGLLDYRLT